MFNFWSLMNNHRSFRQFTILGMVLFSTIVRGQVSPVWREPASYIPDDDVIVKPVDNELSFYQQYVAGDNSTEVIQSRNQIRVWNENQQFADQYGLDSTLTGSAFFVPTPQEKFEYFKDRYMRYLQKKGERPLQDVPQNWYNNFRVSNEVDTIDEMESRFKRTTKKTSADKNLPEALQQKEISLWKQTRFIFQPRVEQGLIVVGIKGPIAYARAWVGINGEAEFNVQKSFESTGTRMMFNYYAHNGRYFTSVDQRIVDNLYARLTSQKNPEKDVKDDSVMLLYATQF